ncbi:hypothetical protein KSP40_PGU015991 [Platanthera guangdongensis]|uniref:Uncharacterized protein n=1 Tax=Platanthera guangdongensis TaxID=2320717 RepID=A0ABR2LEV1_9ASPA
MHPWDRHTLELSFGPNLINLILQVQIDGGRQYDAPSLTARFSGRTISGLTYAALFPSPATSFGWLQKVSLPMREILYMTFVLGCNSHLCLASQVRVEH